MKSEVCRVRDCDREATIFMGKGAEWRFCRRHWEDLCALPWGGEDEGC